MNFQLIRDENDKPYHVNIDTGYMQTSRPYRPEEDGWMEDQIDPYDFPAIQTGRDMEMLVAEVNRLRRENFRLEKEVEVYRKASGFGG
jgi:hypothetical protein